MSIENFLFCWIFHLCSFIFQSFLFETFSCRFIRTIYLNQFSSFPFSFYVTILIVYHFCSRFTDGAIWYIKMYKNCENLSVVNEKFNEYKMQRMIMKSEHNRCLTINTRILFIRAIISIPFRSYLLYTSHAALLIAFECFRFVGISSLCHRHQSQLDFLFAVFIAVPIF